MDDEAFASFLTCIRSFQHWNPFLDSLITFLKKRPKTLLMTKFEHSLRLKPSKMEGFVGLSLTKTVKYAIVAA